jgi:hypothetical protein
MVLSTFQLFRETISLNKNFICGTFREKPVHHLYDIVCAHVLAAFLFLFSIGMRFPRGGLISFV